MPCAAAMPCAPAQQVARAQAALVEALRTQCVEQRLNLRIGHAAPQQRHRLLVLLRHTPLQTACACRSEMREAERAGEQQMCVCVCGVRACVRTEAPVRLLVSSSTAPSSSVRSAASSSSAGARAEMCSACGRQGAARQHV
jgi:hypothetical protein